MKKLLVSFLLVFGLVSQAQAAYQCEVSNGYNMFYGTASDPDASCRIAINACQANTYTDNVCVILNYYWIN